MLAQQIQTPAQTGEEQSSSSLAAQSAHWNRLHVGLIAAGIMLAGAGRTKAAPQAAIGGAV